MARPEGFEPPAFGIGIHCDIQLRHGRLSARAGGARAIVIVHHFSPLCKREFTNRVSALVLVGTQAQGNHGDVVVMVSLDGDGGVHHRLRQRLHIPLVGIGGQQFLHHSRATA